MCAVTNINDLNTGSRLCVWYQQYQNVTAALSCSDADQTSQRANKRKTKSNPLSPLHETFTDRHINTS